MTDTVHEDRHDRHTGPVTSRAERASRTHELLAAAQETTDEVERAALLDEVIVLNRCVADAVARRYRGRGVPMDDLRQSAFEGLVKAVHKFDPSVRPDLLTYAVPTIRGEVQRWFRDQSWMVRPPRRIQEMQWQVNRSIDALSQSLGRPPTDTEVSDDVGCTRAELDEVQQAFGCFRPRSLDWPLDGVSGLVLGDLLVEERDEQSSTEARVVLGPVVAMLPAADRTLLSLRFVEELSQSDIGQLLGLSQMQVSRRLARLMRQLRVEVAA